MHQTVAHMYCVTVSWQRNWSGLWLDYLHEFWISSHLSTQHVCCCTRFYLFIFLVWLLCLLTSLQTVIQLHHSAHILAFGIKSHLKQLHIFILQKSSHFWFVFFLLKQCVCVYEVNYLRRFTIAVKNVTTFLNPSFLTKKS